MIPKKLIIFDFDGPIVNSFDACLSISKKGNANLTAEQYREMFRGNIYRAMALRKTLEYPEGFDFWKAYSEKVLPLEPVPGVKDTIEILKKNKLHCAIISSTHSNSIRAYLNKYKLAEFFEDILGSDVNPSKVEKFKILHEQYNIPYSDMIFITDTLGDLLEASKLSIKSIAITWGYHSAETLREGPFEAIINNPSELAKQILAVENQ